MSRRSISSVVQQFLTEIQYYSDSEIESIITYLPNPAVANVTGVRRLLVELQSEYSNVNDVIECTQSQPVHQAGVGRGIKRLLNESDDQDSVKELTQTRKRKSVDVEEDESCYTTKLTKFVCPKGKDFFERMESLEDLNRYKESKEYQDVIENQLVRRGKEGRKLQNMVDAQEKIFQALDNLRDGNTNMLDSAALVSETVRMPTGADTIIIETEEDYLDSEEDGLRKENDQEKGIIQLSL